MDRLHHHPSQLSGGQQQRVAIARALVNHPVLVLADEPTGALDSQTSIEIMQLFQRLNREGITIVLVTHEPDVARFARRLLRFKDGKLVKSEPVTDSVADPGAAPGAGGTDAVMILEPGRDALQGLAGEHPAQRPDDPWHHHRRGRRDCHGFGRRRGRGQGGESDQQPRDRT